MNDVVCLRLLAILAAALVLAGGCAQAGTMSLSSPAFSEGGTIPSRYSCEGEDLSPPLSWTGAPESAAGFAIIVEDPDAPSGTFVHWVIYHIPGVRGGLDECLAATPEPGEGAKQGLNDFGRIGYGGPCPPAGRPHRYIFTLYALDGILEIPQGASAATLRHAVEGHVLEAARLTGIYARGKTP